MLTSVLIVALLAMVAVSVTAIVFASHATVAASRLREAVEDHAVVTAKTTAWPTNADRALYRAAGIETEDMTKGGG